MAQIEHKTVKDSQDELLSLLDRDGGVIIEGVLNNVDLSQVRSDLSSYIDASPAGENLPEKHLCMKKGQI